VPREGICRTLRHGSRMPCSGETPSRKTLVAVNGSVPAVSRGLGRGLNDVAGWFEIVFALKFAPLSLKAWEGMRNDAILTGVPCLRRDISWPSVRRRRVCCSALRRGAFRGGNNRLLSPLWQRGLGCRGRAALERARNLRPDL
jgi:hypothetical protein